LVEYLELINDFIKANLSEPVEEEEEPDSIEDIP